MPNPSRPDANEIPRRLFLQATAAATAATADPQIELRIRNIVDAPSTAPRGGGSINRPASETGRKPSSQLPDVRTLPNAAVHLATTLGEPVRGTCSLPDGTLGLRGLIGIAPGAQLILTAFDGSRTGSQLLHTEST